MNLWRESCWGFEEDGKGTKGEDVEQAGEEFMQRAQIDVGDIKKVQECRLAAVE
jgi:hypothetical protein